MAGNEGLVSGSSSSGRGVLALAGCDGRGAGDAGPDRSAGRPVAAGASRRGRSAARCGTSSCGRGAGGCPADGCLADGCLADGCLADGAGLCGPRWAAVGVWSASRASAARLSAVGWALGRLGVRTARTSICSVRSVGRPVPPARGGRERLGVSSGSGPGAGRPSVGRVTSAVRSAPRRCRAGAAAGAAAAGVSGRSEATSAQ